MTFGIQCNIKAVHRFLRMGARCIIVGRSGDGGERFKVQGRARNGRKVTAYVDSCDLANFRPHWIPPDQDAVPFAETREEAARIAADLNKRFGARPIREHVVAFTAAREVT